MNITDVAVIGAGTMGNGIAHVFAQNGYQVTLADMNQQALDQAAQIIERNLDRQVKKEILTAAEKAEALQRIQYTTSIIEAAISKQLIVEAVSENFAVKESIFKTLDEQAPEQALLASNTSSISITRLAAATQRPQQVIGMHFMNPVPVMKLVEVIRGYATSDHTTRQIMDLSEKLGKIPVEVQDYPGFISNRVLMPMINEAIYALYEGVAGVEEIDTVMKLGMAHPMGPLELADFIGLDVCHSILHVLYDGFGNQKYAPCPLLTNMVTAGNNGVKAGAGFYVYQKGNKDKEIAPQFL